MHRTIQNDFSAPSRPASIAAFLLALVFGPAVTPLAIAQPMSAAVAGTTSTEAAAPPAPSIPLEMLDEETLRERIRLSKTDATIQLLQVRVVRARDFTEDADGDTSASAIPFAPSGPMRNLFRPGMAFVFRVSTPDHCGILDINNSSLTQLTDQNGLTIRRDAPAESPDALSETGFLSWERTAALIQIGTGLPPRGDERLGRVAGELTVDVGIVQPIQIVDLRNKSGQMLLDRPDGVDLTVRLNSISNDEIVVIAEGAVKRLGAYEFLTPEGAEIPAYANTVDVEALPPDARPRQTTTYSFFSLPEQIDLRINYYSRIDSKTLTIDYADLPLP
jgi:hypothetical protein